MPHSSKENDLVIGKRKGKLVLSLYVAGTTPKATRAITNLKKVLDQYIPNEYELRIIDIYQQPVLAEGEQIICAPTLIKSLPLPVRRLIGDMSNQGRILTGLGLIP